MIQILFKLRALLFVSAFFAIILPGCTPLNVPRYGSGTFKIIEGGLVETIVFDGKETFNIQVTKECVPEYKYLTQHILTIGKFSPVIGSGFTSRADIYYESTIDEQGNDTFKVGDASYQVFWKEIEVIPGRKDTTTSVFSITIKQLNY